MKNNPQIKKRAVNGILLLDKPVGISSNTALQAVKRLFQAKKAGHTGSLDPLASGMLPICFGEATKFTQFLLNADKSYQVTAKLGVKTTTGDKEGDVVETQPPAHIDEKVISELFEAFTGTLNQVPSMYSALKHNGQPLYKLARQGIEVERPARKIQIHKLELISYTEDEITFNVQCSKGTYVRTLVQDMGDKLGCGAHVIALRRLNAAHFEADQMKTFDEIEGLKENMTALDKLLFPTECIIQDMPVLSVSEAAIYYLKQGQYIISPDAPESGLIKLMQKGGSFIGIGEVRDGRVAPKKLIQA